MENQKSCPYCGEEIMAVARKCKHCGEWLDDSMREEDDDEDEDEDDDEDTPRLRNYVVRPIEALVGWLLFYFGGWHFITDISDGVLNKLGFSGGFIMKEWGAQLLGSLGNMELPSVLAGKHSLLVSINESYCGFICDKNFFDAPAIQWIMLITGIVVIVDAVFNFIFFFKRTV